ncbi:MAG: hypothetical protein EOP84_16895 [Verrucomicrobiaceae bacterium]|nr:MAG: hypothetical protein EOP84_16895 [Verrucomicrobiaceae bacterium]
MPEDDQPEKVWDEYDWERFLQQQDRKTEKYMELLERYIDDPNRDQIIAREMGWEHLIDKEGQEWAESVDSQFAEEIAAQLEDEDDDHDDDGEHDDDDDDEEMDEEAEGFEVHPLYQAAFALTAWVDQMFEECGDRVLTHPVAVRLSTHAAVAGAKLAAALSDDDIDELGMTIAYLKRALHAVTISLDCAVELREDRLIGSAQFGGLNQRLFHVRDGIIELMGEYRAEWRRRYGR